MTPNRPLFNVECPSCEAKFAVTDPGLVGEIVACPKCGGMILIEPPQNAREAEVSQTAQNVPIEQTRQSEQDATVARETQDAKSTEASEAAQIDAFSTVPVPPPVCDKEEAGAPPKAAPPRYRPERIAKEPKRAGKDSPRDANGKKEVGVSNETAKNKARNGKKVALLVGGCALGALALGGAIYWGAAGSNKAENAETNVEDAAATAKDGETLPLAQGESDTSDSNDSSDDGELSRDESAAFVGEFDPRGVETLAPTSDESGTNGDKNGDIVESVEEISPQTDAPNDGEEAESPVSDADIADNVGEESGANLNASEGAAVYADGGDSNESKSENATEPKSASTSDAPKREQPSTVEGETQNDEKTTTNATDENNQKYDSTNSKVKNDADEDEIPTEEDLGEVASTTDLTFSSALPTMKREIPKIDVDKRLSLRLKSLDCPRSPAATVRLLSELSGVPIAFDLDSFNLLRASTGTTLELKLADVDVGKALDKLAELLKWRVYKEENGVVLRSLDAEDGVFVEERFEIGDLVGDERDAKADESLQKFVLPNNLTASDVAVFLRSSVAPESWEENGGEGTIVVDDANKALSIRQTTQNRKEIAFLLERLRAFRSGEPSGAKVGEIIPETLCWERLSKKIAFNLLEPTPLQNAIATLEKSQKGDLEVVWDDAALNDADVGRDAAVQIRVDSGSIDRILTDMLEPIGLTYLILSDKLIEITTKTRAANYWTNEAFAPKKSSESNAPNGGKAAVDRRTAALAALGIVGEETANDDGDETDGKNGGVNGGGAQDDISASELENGNGGESPANAPVVWVDARSGAAFVRQSQPQQRVLRRALEAKEKAQDEITEPKGKNVADGTPTALPDEK